MSTSPQLIKIVARFVRADSGAPLTGPGYRVRFYDFDLIRDDRLGESGLSPDGVAEVICSAADYQGGILARLFDRLKEKKPDLFVEVVESDRAVFRSPIQWNVDPLKVDEVTGRINPTVDLGTYQFREGEGITDEPWGLGVHKPLM
ncbi:MAG: hypothetical protein KF805_00220 [Phycisphaeraceae bacterium]|nr:hypothetical protein [Phycisphaeraceae bacterium]